MIFYKVYIGHYANEHSISKISLNKHDEFIRELNKASDEHNGYKFGEIHLWYFRTRKEAETHIKEYPNGAR